MKKIMFSFFVVFTFYKLELEINNFLADKREKNDIGKGGGGGGDPSISYHVRKGMKLESVAN